MLGTPIHGAIVIVDLPEETIAIDFERCEVVLTVRVVVTIEIGERSHL